MDTIDKITAALLAVAFVIGVVFAWLVYDARTQRNHTKPRSVIPAPTAPIKPQQVLAR